MDQLQKFQTCTLLAVQGVGFLKTQNMKIFFIISSYKKFYRKQPVEFLMKEQVFLEKSDLSFLKSSFLKAGLYGM